MKNQPKATYTRRFNKLKTALIEYYSASKEDFDAEVCVSDTASLRWGPECCVVSHDGDLGFTLYFRNDETFQFEAVSIVKTPHCYLGGLVGIHVRETDLSHLVDCIDTALKDGFESIYVSSVGAVSRE